MLLMSVIFTSVSQSELLASELESMIAIDDAVSARRLANWEVPAVALPPELLSDIFFICVGRYKYREPERNLFQLTRYRRAIVGVCHRWRQVARATQDLWAVTEFSSSAFAPLNPLCTDFSDRVSRRSAPFYRDLELAGTAPITLISRFEHESSMTPEVIPQFEHCFETALIPMLPRCKRAVLQGSGQLPLRLLNSSSTQLTKLESLEIQACGRRPESNTQPRTLDLSHACNIRDLSITLTKGWARSSHEVTIPIFTRANQLQTLTISGYVDSVAAFKIISQATSLRSLVWSPDNELLRLQTPQEEINLPFLRFLTLGSAALPIIPKFHAKALLTLTLLDAALFIFPEHTRFPLLRALVLQGLVWPSDPFVKLFLHKHPSLEWFAIEGMITPYIAAACATAPKLQFLEAHWNPKLEGPRLLLDHWSGQVASGSRALDAYEMCLVNDDRHGPWFGYVSDEDLTEAFGHRHGIRVKTIHRPWLIWSQPKNWDQLFQQADTSYEPCF
ncbi:hypothetical protein DL93DRAFT_1557241 [Clavulina sp. PMI_390]|nr:hypothetical protein DL93DRAFT_1557241 [Clavulina sp. PMI_390]